MPTIEFVISSTDPEFEDVSGEVLGEIESIMEKHYGIGGPKYTIEWEYRA